MASAYVVLHGMRKKQCLLAMVDSSRPSIESCTWLSHFAGRVLCEAAHMALIDDEVLHGQPQRPVSLPGTTHSLAIFARRTGHDVVSTSQAQRCCSAAIRPASGQELACQSNSVPGLPGRTPAPCGQVRATPKTPLL